MPVGRKQKAILILQLYTDIHLKAQDSEWSMIAG